MLRINNITQDPKQVKTVVLPDGGTFTMEISFSDLQQCWFIDRLEHEDFILRGFTIYNSINMLRQFSNQIPFGLACISDNKREPSLLQDFFYGASRLYVLTPEEVERYESHLRGR